ncbi:right-handed parallel beta-helix repeat-containing protein [Pedobacter sp. SYSU D00535]|uniref:right-handed parallel beta-helix repeat-containing protein n=1 Tax=Pedobacter sp. SYSU D00535 TaxID=2810308 RepID=UPI001A95E65D|nr:right-handed parallel beta-helix repeat-containing protein [Pedobacter sp. SYSU D00535]
MLAITATLSCQKGESESTPSEDVTSAGKSSAKALASGEVVNVNGQWRATVNGVQRYLGSDYIAAINAAIGGLTAGRTTKEWVTIKNSGSSGNSGGSVKAVNMQSYTGLDFSNTTFTCNSNDLLIVPVQADRKTQIEVKNLRVSGNPRYGIWFKGCTNMIISNITMNLTNGSGQYGLGIRVDNSTAATSNLTINGTQSFTGGDMHIETYGVSGFNIGNVTTSNNYGCGVLLNQSRNGSVGTVTGNRNCNGGGYATFRVANNNGPSVTCAKVYSRSSGRGFFSVSGSNGTTVTTVDIANNTSHGIFLEDASNTRVNGGTVSGCRPNVQHVRTTSCVTNVNGQSYTAANGTW